MSRARARIAAAAAATAALLVVAQVARRTDAPEVASGRPAPRAADPSPAAAAPSHVRVAPPPAPAPAAARRPEPFRSIPFFRAERRTGDLGRIARDLIDENRDALGLTSMPGELTLRREFDTLSGRHTRFVQTIDGVPVFGSEVSAHVTRDGRPLLVQADVYPVEGAATRPRIGARAALAAARAWMRPEGARESVETKEARLVVLPEGRRGRLAWRVDARTSADSARLFVDAEDGTVVRSDSLRVADNGTGSVFDPNPIVATRNGNLEDVKNADTEALTRARALVVLPRLDGSGVLRGTWADCTATTAPATSGILNFAALTRSDPGFEQVMAYFHVDRLQERLRGLGVTDANAEAQKADAHALSEDQSYYDSFNDVLRFGDGGVDDAEDADIIRHEYGHAIQYDQVEDYGLTDEGSAIGEGFGDFLAAVDHASDPVFEPLVGSWDAASYSKATPPYLRRVDTDRRYPGGLVNEPHADGQLWSRLLWDLRALVGRDDALRLVVESQFLYTNSVRFSSAVNALLLTNIALRDGADDIAIRDLIEARGFVYSVPFADPPDDDALEPNDDIDHPSPLAAGNHPGLVSVDDDWYRLDVPAGRRYTVRVTATSGNADLDLSLLARVGPTSFTDELVDTSANAGSVESVNATAGNGGAVFVLRVFDGAIGTHAATYDIDVIDADLETLASGRAVVATLAPHAPLAYRVDVPATKVGRRLSVSAARQKKGGASAEVRVTAPDGTVVVDFGAGARAGSRATVDLNSPGSWIVEIRSRDAARGKAKLRAAIK